jgi:hypothetical protein
MAASLKHKTDSQGCDYVIVADLQGSQCERWCAGVGYFFRVVIRKNYAAFATKRYSWCNPPRTG